MTFTSRKRHNRIGLRVNEIYEIRIRGEKVVVATVMAAANGWWFWYGSGYNSSAEGIMFSTPEEAIAHAKQILPEILK